VTSKTVLDVFFLDGIAAEAIDSCWLVKVLLKGIPDGPDLRDG
jgi:hypothetical protein